MTITLRIQTSKLERVIKIIEEKLNNIEKELKETKHKLQAYEEKYGVTTSQLLEMLQGKQEWKLPDNADIDIVEWEALAHIHEKLVKEQKLLEETKQLITKQTTQ